MYDGVSVIIHEIALYMDPPRKHDDHDIDQPLELMNLSRNVRTKLTLSCLEAAKKFLDHWIQLPPFLGVRHSIIEKGFLASSIAVLIKLAISAGDNADVDVPHFRQACDVSRYLSSLAMYSGNLSSSLACPEQSDSFRRFESLLICLKTWYSRSIDNLHGSTASDIVEMSPLALVESSVQDTVVSLDWDLMDMIHFQHIEF
jgi:hypothetical protein